MKLVFLLSVLCLAGCRPAVETPVDKPGPFLSITIKPVAPLPFGEPCLAPRVSLVDSQGRLYLPPDDVCDGYFVELAEGESAGTVQVVVEGPEGGYELTVRPA